ncbi:MAG: amidase family protein, partial [Candidatus Acidiferrales bacterium]
MTSAAPWTITGVREALQAKKISARELIKEFYARIASQNPELNAYLTLCPERAYAQADRLDARVAQGSPVPPLGGVPVAVKDV